MLKYVKERHLEMSFKDIITATEDDIHLKKVICLGVELGCILAMFFVRLNIPVMLLLTCVIAMTLCVVGILQYQLILVILEMKKMLYQYSRLVWDLVWSVEAPNGIVKEEDQTNFFKLFCDAQEIQYFLYEKYQSSLRKPDENLKVLEKDNKSFFQQVNQAVKDGTAHNVRKPLDYLTYLDTFPNKLPG